MIHQTLLLHGGHFQKIILWAWIWWSSSQARVTSTWFQEKVGKKRHVKIWEYFYYLVKRGPKHPKNPKHVEEEGGKEEEVGELEKAKDEELENLHFLRFLEALRWPGTGSWSPSWHWKQLGTGIWHLLGHLALATGIHGHLVVASCIISEFSRS